jgi:hypothetical protein
MSAGPPAKPHPPLREAPIWRKYGYTLVTAALFIMALAGHWLFAWYAYVDEQLQHNAPVEFQSYLMQVGRDTLENWQSEFLQLIWQVAGLALLLHVSSPQSHENEDRLEAKIDILLKAAKPRQADEIIADLDARYDRH